MVVGARELNRWTLARQLLPEGVKLDAVSAVERLAGRQTQYPPSPYIALWSRRRGFRREELEAAVLDGRVYKATLMRGTLHSVRGRPSTNAVAVGAKTSRPSNVADMVGGRWSCTLTVQDVAMLTGSTVAAIYQWRRRGKGPKGVRVGNKILFRPRYIEAWLEWRAEATRQAANG